MINNAEAEHIPGCNMAFRKWALDSIGGFDPTYIKAGDDVDICWRLQERGLRLGFAPGALVWHHHRASVKAYFRQQVGYGEGESFLQHRHTDRFNERGHVRWAGRSTPLPLSSLFRMSSTSLLFRAFLRSIRRPLLWAPPADGRVAGADCAHCSRPCSCRGCSCRAPSRC